MADRTSNHGSHDSELIAGCPDCDALAPDLAALSTSLASLRGGLDSGHRDFRIAPHDAQRLRRGRGLRAWLRPLAGGGFGFARPLGSALTLVALVGLVASSPAGTLPAKEAFEAAGQATDYRNGLTEPPPAAAPGSPSLVFGGAAGSPTVEPSGDAAATQVEATLAPSAVGVPGATDRDPDRANPFFLASLVLLPIGLLLLVGQGLARRLIGAAREP